MINWSTLIKKYDPVLLPVFVQSCLMEWDNTINCFSVIMLACIKKSYIFSSCILAEYFKHKSSPPLIYINKWTKPSKCTLPGFDENNSSLCTEKHKSTLVHKIWINGTTQHRWELPVSHPVFNVVMVIYHYVERIWRILITPNYLYKIYEFE